MSLPITEKLPFSGRLLKRLTNEEFTFLELHRFREQPNELAYFKKYGPNYGDVTYLSIYSEGIWKSFSENKELADNLTNEMQEFINNYIIQLLNKVKDDYFKEQILELLDYAKFTNLSSIILALEVLVTCAVTNPENFQFIYALLKEPSSHFNYSNSPWILLSLLYGNDELAANLLTSLYNSSEPYFAEAKTYAKDLKALLDASHNQEHLAKIDTQIKSLQIPPYVDLPF